MELKVNGLKNRISSNQLEIDDFLVNIIQDAAKKALEKLFREYNESFYYCTLMTTGEGLCPRISAFSEEALERVLLDKIKKRPVENIEQKRENLRWSYADSPYYAYGYEEYFLDVEDILLKRKEKIKSNNNEDEVDKELDNEIDLIINSMEKVMANLDAEGMFGEGEERNKIFINAEFMPPDASNVMRALRLNPNESLKNWLTEDDLEELNEWLNELESSKN